MTKKPLKICMLIDTWFPFIGGGQMHIKYLIKSLSKHRVKVVLFHSPHHNIVIRFFWNLLVIPQVLMTNKKQNFDLIHAHAFSAAIPGKIISILLRLPVLYTVHGSHLMDIKSQSIKAWLEKLLLTQIRFTHQISVNKTFTKYPNVNKNITVIPNGVDITAFNAIKCKKRNSFTLLYVGRTHPTKGLHILDSAFKKVITKYPQIRLKLITDGQLTGKKLFTEYKKAHGFVLPSLAEGQPLTLVEAWAAKLPVIATKTSGVKEIAQHNHDAILVKPGNALQLAQAIIKLFKMTPRARSKLGENGYKKAKTLSWDKISLQTLRLYKKYT